MQKLYKYGARKVALAGIGRIGCAPNSLSLHDTNGSACVDHINNAVEFFNVKLLTLVDQLNTNLTDAKFIYINSYGMGGGDPTAVGTYTLTQNFTLFFIIVNLTKQIYIISYVVLYIRNREKKKYILYVFLDGFSGFKNWKVGCCAVNEVGQCVQSQKPCENRREYVFWDSFHPTEALNIVTASRIYSAFDLSDSYPMDVNQLIQMPSDSSL